MSQIVQKMTALFLLAALLLVPVPAFAQGLSPQCHPPVAVDDAYEVRENLVLEVLAPGVLGNDTDQASLPLTAAVTVDAEHGSLTLNADGSFAYTPEPGFFGTDQFTYRAMNQYYASHGYYDEAVVTLTVVPLPRLYFPIVQK